METNLLGHVIGAWKLAGQCDGLYYAIIDGKADFDIIPSKYPSIVFRRIRTAYSNWFILDGI